MFTNLTLQKDNSSKCMTSYYVFAESQCSTLFIFTTRQIRSPGHNLEDLELHCIIALHVLAVGSLLRLNRGFGGSKTVNESDLVTLVSSIATHRDQAHQERGRKPYLGGFGSETALSGRHWRDNA
jgi:hypothetical protein